MSRKDLLLYGMALVMTVLVIKEFNPFRPTSALAQGGYDLSWWTVDSGGGSSSGGGYSLSGSIGQAEVGTLNGGGYSLSGGFWFGEGVTAGPEQVKVYLPLVLK